MPTVIALGFITQYALINRSTSSTTECDSPAAPGDSVTDRLGRIEKILENLDPETRILSQISQARKANKVRIFARAYCDG